VPVQSIERELVAIFAEITGCCGGSGFLDSGISQRLTGSRKSMKGGCKRESDSAHSRSDVYKARSGEKTLPGLPADCCLLNDRSTVGD
jgi:hypothetical protein